MAPYRPQVLPIMINENIGQDLSIRK